MTQDLSQRLEDATEGTREPRSPDEFWCNPREDEFCVVVRVEATVRETVKAADADEARAKIKAMINADELEVYGQDIDDARIDWVRPELPMYLVSRPGTNVSGSSRIEPGDEPREPKDDYERRTYTRAPTIAKATASPDTGEGG